MTSEERNIERARTELSSLEKTLARRMQGIKSIQDRIDTLKEFLNIDDKPVRTKRNGTRSKRELNGESVGTEKQDN